MKLSTSKKSWHYRLATYGGIDEYEDQTNLCSYFWAVTRGIGLATLLVAVGVLFGFFLVMAPAIQLIALLLGVPFVLYGPAIAGYLFWITIALLVTIHFLGSRAKTAIGATSAAKLVATGYRGWKEKTCVLIDIK